MHITVEIHDTDAEYLRSCARIRDISVTALMRLLLETIARDQLVLAVLDDNGQQAHPRYARRYREPNHGEDPIVHFERLMAAKAS